MPNGKQSEYDLNEGDDVGICGEDISEKNRIKAEQERANLTEHRRCYPAQYNHPLVGKTVRVKKYGEAGASANAAHKDVSGVVSRVVGSRFGTLASLNEEQPFESLVWYLTSDLVVIPSNPEGDQP